MPVESSGNKQAEWRTDPALSGPGGCIANVGTHAFNLATFVTGLVASAVLVDLPDIGPDRTLDGCAAILLAFLLATQQAKPLAQAVWFGKSGMAADPHPSGRA